MRAFGVLLVVAVLAGCMGTQGERGPAGPQGERGEAGPQGAPGVDGASAGGWVWVDATGVVVGRELLYVDQLGRIWQINSETGSVDPALLPKAPTHYFESADCTGEFLPYWPRYVFQALGTSEFRVRGDRVMSVPIDSRSFKSSPTSACVGTLQTIRGLRLGDVEVVPAAPTMNFTAPLHPETR